MSISAPRDRSTGRGLRAARAKLEEQAHLFDDPGAYLAGVDDTFAALAGRGPVAVEPGGLSVVVEPDEGVGRSDRARYLAALTVGLVTAGRDSREVIDELTDAAGTCSELLQQAARCVYSLRVGDPEHRRTAEALLLQAVIECRPPMGSERRN